MLLDHCYAIGFVCCSLFSLKQKFIEDSGPPVTYFGPVLDPPPWTDLAEKQQHL